VSAGQVLLSLTCITINFIMMFVTAKRLELSSSNFQCRWAREIWDYAIKVTRWQHHAMQLGARFAVCGSTSCFIVLEKTTVITDTYTCIINI